MALKKRKNTTPTVRTNIAFPAPLHRGLVRLANQRGISINALVLELVQSSWGPQKDVDTHSPNAVG